MATTWDNSTEGDPGSGGADPPTDVHQYSSGDPGVSFDTTGGHLANDVVLVPDTQTDPFGLGIIDGDYIISGFDGTHESVIFDTAGAQTYQAYANMANGGSAVSPWSDPGTVTVANDSSHNYYRPDGPTDLDASRSGSNTVFTYNFDDGSNVPFDEEVNFELYGVTAGNQLYSYTPIDTVTWDGESSSISDTVETASISSDIKQVFVVAHWSREDYGGYSDYSNYVEVNDLDAPAAPTNLTVTVPYSSGTLAAHLLWDDNSDNEDGFYVQRKLSSEDDTYWSTIATVGKDVTQYQDTLPNPWTDAYDYQIIAFAGGDGAGGSGGTGGSGGAATGPAISAPSNIASLAPPHAEIHLMPANSDISGTTQNWVVGQKVQVEAQLITPFGWQYTLQNGKFKWTVDPGILAGYLPINFFVHQAQVVPVSKTDLSQQDLSYFWVATPGGNAAGENRDVHLTITVGTQQYTAAATFNVETPAVTFTGTATTDSPAIALGANVLPGGGHALFLDVGSAGSPGMTFNGTVTTNGIEAGDIEIVQLISNRGSSVFNHNPSDPSNKSWDTNGYLLDDDENYDIAYKGNIVSLASNATNVPISGSDSPDSGYITNMTQLMESWYFHTYLMYRPTGGSWVPLSEFDWSAAATAVFGPPNSVSGITAPQNETGAHIISEPGWNNDYQSWLKANGFSR